MKYIAIAIGGAIGSLLRYTISIYLNSADYPAGTLVANISGSFVIGCLLGIGMDRWSADWKLFIVTGLLGGFTTFSSFSLETLNMFRGNRIFTGISYLSLSVAGSILAAYLGFMVGKFIPEFFVKGNTT